MNTIFAKILYEMEMRRDSMLVSIISERGSAPQKAGAQMLVGHGGRLCGTVGGGALEKAAEEMAVDLLSQKRTVTHEFRLHSAKDNPYCRGRLPRRTGEIQIFEAEQQPY